jgi:hypothetical protein
LKLQSSPPVEHEASRKDLLAVAETNKTRPCSTVCNAEFSLIAAMSRVDPRLKRQPI